MSGEAIHVRTFQEANAIEFPSQVDVRLLGSLCNRLVFKLHGKPLVAL